MNKTTPKTLYKVNKPVAIKINPIITIGFILFFFLIFFVIGLLSVSDMNFILTMRC